MRMKLRRLLAVVLCLALCVGNLLTVGAAGENNTQGITFMAVLDTPEIQTSDSDQTVVMRINASQAVTVDGIGFTVIKDSALTIAGITGGEAIGSYDATATNLTTGVAAWNSADSENVTGVTELAVVTFTVPTGTAAGAYSVGFTNLELTENYGTIWENAASATAVLTVEAATETEGYTAGISSDSTTVEKGKEVSIKVSASHSDAAQTVFNADEVVIGYDSSKLSFDQNASTLNGATVEVDQTNSKLKIANHGDNRSFGDIYTLVFDTIATGTAAVTLERAAFINKEGAKERDLEAATINPSAVNLTINEAQFTVTLPSDLADVIEGDETVAAGSAYEFKVLDTNYTYVFSGTMGGQSVGVTSTDGETFTVDQVTGDLTITLVTKTPKSYSVTIGGSGTEDVTAEDGSSVQTTATYNVPYVFKVNAAKGYGYQVSITVNGKAYTGYTVSEDGGVYTIPGTAITGGIVITVEKSASDATVTVTGNGAGIAAGYETIAELGSPYTLSVTPEVGYNYTITATMGGNEVDLTVSDDKTTYTTPNVTGNIVFTIARSVDTTSVTVAEKVTISGGTVYAVSYATKLADNKVPTYDGNSMYWSENHNAYIYLVIGTSLSTEDAKAEIGIEDGTVVVVENNSDINGTTVVDASDAQYVWNMYNAQYSEFTEEVTMAEFIKADRNADYKIDMQDAAAIINQILGKTTE